MGEEYPFETQTTVQTALKDALRDAAAVEGIAMQDDCDRDYSSACPVGWSDEGDGDNCSSPFDYNGQCPELLSFGGLTPLEKRAKAARCGAEFPCGGARSPDFNQPCPAGWSLD